MATARTITTVLFDGQFWVALVERHDGRISTIARHVFGPEPTNAELLDWSGQGLDALRFLPMDVQAPLQPMPGPKRRKRELAKVKRQKAQSTASQEAFRVALEENRQEARVARRRKRREERKQRYAGGQQGRNQRRK